MNTSNSTKALKSFLDFQNYFMSCEISTPFKLYNYFFKILVSCRYNLNVDDLYQFYLYDTNRKLDPKKKSILYKSFNIFF